MDAQTFVEQLLPLQNNAIEQYINDYAPQVDDLDVVARRLSDEARAWETRDLEVSRRVAHQLLALARWTGVPYHHALGLLALGNVLKDEGRHREAIAYLDEAGARFIQAREEVGWARTRISYLWSASQIGLTEQALEQAERARAIFIRHNEHKRAGDLDVSMALALTGIGRYQEALVMYDRALLTYRPSDPKQAAHHRAVVLANKALTLEMLGNFYGAIACEQEARAIFEQEGELLRVAWVDHNLAAYRANLGQYSAALHLYYQALEYYQRFPSLRNWVALCSSNMADCLLRLNRAPEARQLAERAVTLYRTLDETANLGWALVRLARALSACGQVEAALNALSEARSQFERVGDVATVGLVLLTHAELLLSIDPAQAMVTAEQALAIFQSYQMESWIAEAHFLQGRVYEIAGDMVQARLLAEQARKEARETQLSWLEFGCEHLLGRLAQQQGAMQAAESHYQAALSLLDGIMGWLVRDQRSSFLADKEGIFSALIKLALNQQKPDVALGYLERLKSQVLREYLMRSGDIRLKASDPAEAQLLAELQRLREELHGSCARIAELEKVIQGASIGEQAHVVRGTPRNFSLERATQQLLDQQKSEQRLREQAIREVLERAFLQHESARFQILTVPDPNRRGYAQGDTALVERLATILPANCVLLEYFFLDNDLLIFTLHAQHPRVEVITVPGAVPGLSRLLPMFRATIDMIAHSPHRQDGRNPAYQALQANMAALSRRLYKWLIHPIKPHIPPGGRVLIVPYGPLHSLPFHALLSETGYLVEECEVAYLPAAAMLPLLEMNRQAAQPPDNAQSRALILGHSYGGRLPHALQEAQSIAALLKGDCYVEEAATIERLSNTGGNYRIIHLAAHGKSRTDAPDFSYLQLADGQLSMIDVFNLDLPAELVTLSGCETGLVTIGGGDELLGLGRGFLYAGARALVISLWQVEDASTAQLMQHFYMGLLEGQSRAGALRKAQLALLHAARAESSPAIWAHPYFWAPFCLLGDAGTIAF